MSLLPKARIIAMNTNHSKRLHRIATVRKRQGMSLQTAARKMHAKVRQLLEQENESADVPLSTVYAWQKILGVPLTELLIEEEGELASPVLQRARMIRIMKTAVTIRQATDIVVIKRLADRLSDDLIEIMPELKHVTPWPAVGSRRAVGQTGRILDHQVPEDHFFD